jgi:hypothetical protein
MAMNEATSKANIKSGLLTIIQEITTATKAGETSIGGKDFDEYWAEELGNIITAEIASMVRSGSVSTNVNTVTTCPAGAGTGTGSGSGTLS